MTEPSKPVFLLLFYFLLLSGCGIRAFLKVQDAYDAESISSGAFKEVIPFKWVNGQIIVAATFNGVSGDFIFDTGATNKLDSEFASRLALTALGKIKSFDSNNTKMYVPCVKVDELKIGNTSFYNAVASVSNFKSIARSACLDVSGIIGANAMNKCIWQIDFENRLITFTNDRDSLAIPTDIHAIHFSAMGKGTPTVSMYCNSIYWGEAIFDTGSNGGLAINERYMPDSTGYIEKEVLNTGVHSTGKIGQKLGLIPDLSINNEFPLGEVLTSFENGLVKGNIGTQFLKHYVVTFDWISQEILLAPNTQDLAVQNQKDFGFYPRLVDNRVVVGSIRHNSTAFKKGLRLNDHILSMNAVCFDENTFEKYCGLYDKSKRWDSVSVVVQQEDGIFELLLEKELIVAQPIVKE